MDGVGVGVGHQQPQMYEVKPLMPVEHHHAQQYHLEQEPRHDMPWPPPEVPQASQYWTPADEYNKFYTP
jgi:hypothetical protein